MKLKSVYIGIALLCLTTAAWAQDLKPVKDKATKLFGYQDKSKNWVIEPSFNAAKRFIGGFAIVEQDGPFITGRGPAAAMEFGYTLEDFADNLEPESFSEASKILADQAEKKSK